MCLIIRVWGEVVKYRIIETKIWKIEKYQNFGAHPLFSFFRRFFSVQYGNFFISIFLEKKGEKCNKWHLLISLCILLSVFFFVFIDSFQCPMFSRFFYRYSDIRHPFFSLLLILLTSSQSISWTGDAKKFFAAFIFANWGTYRETRHNWSVKQKFFLTRFFGLFWNLLSHLLLTMILIFTKPTL